MTQLLCFFQSVFKQDEWLANTITALYLPRLTSINSPASRLIETQQYRSLPFQWRGLRFIKSSQPEYFIEGF